MLAGQIAITARNRRALECWRELERTDLNIDKYKSSFTKRAAEVMLSLCVDPRSLPSYFATLNKEPLELGLPWISFGALRFLEGFLRPSMQVFEYGSGGSTVFFANRCQSVVSVEDDAEWAQRVRDRLNGAQNATVIFSPTAQIGYGSDGLPFESTDFSGSDYLRAFDGLTPEVVMIDGSEDWLLKRTRRSICFHHVEPAMKEGGIIILDDSWAYPQLKADNRAKRAITFWGVGPCRKGCTSTDIFFY